MNKSIHILLIILLIFSGFVVMLISVPLETSAYTPHDPISINGDADFAEQAASEGWPGAGTQGNPYVIEGYEINATFTHGIAISNTEVHFTIKDNEVRDGSRQYCGIFFNNISNGTVKNCILSNNDNGIWMLASRNSKVDNSTFQQSNNVDIDISTSTGITLINNEMESNGISISGYELEHFNLHNIDSSNLLGGKPVQYWSNKNGGMIPSGAGQIILTNCSNATVVNQEISDANIGVLMAYSSNCVIQNNTLTILKQCGISILRSHNSTIYKNIVSDSDEKGMFLDRSSGNTISDNILDDNYESGIYLRESDSNSIYNNVLLRPTYANHWGDGGIKLESSKWNTIARNNISNYTHGLVLGGSDENVIEGNIMHNNGYYSSYWGWYSWGVGIYISHSSNNRIINNSIQDNPYGMYISSSTYIKLYNNSFINDGLVIAGYEMQHYYSHYISSDNTINSKPLVYLFNQTGGVVSKGAGQIILVNCSNMMVENQDISHTTIGVQLRLCFNVTVTNNSFHSNGVGGINLFESNESVISNNLITDSENGIYLSDSNANIITNNSIIDNRGNGIGIDSSNNNNISQNNLSLNNGVGIELSSSEENIITHNDVLSNGGQFGDGGISLRLSNRNNVSNNNLFDNIHGFHLVQSNNNSFKENIVEDNENGIHLQQDSEFNNISGNIVTNNTFGIYLEHRVSDNYIFKNAVSGNERGIFISRTGSNNLIQNTIINNNEGIVLDDSNEILIFENDFVGNGFALHLDSSRINTIQKNTISHGQRGIFLEESWNNNLTENSISNMNESGIHLSYSSENLININEASQNKYGVFAHFSDRNDIVFNTIESSKEYGIYLNDSNNNIFHHNHIKHNNQQLLLRHSENIWDDGDGEGNYWSDYKGIDEDDDGVGESKLPHQGVDWFPMTDRKKDILSDPLLLIFLGPLVIILIFILVLGFRKMKKKPEENIKEESEEPEENEQTPQQPSQQPSPPPQEIKEP